MDDYFHYTSFITDTHISILKIPSMNNRHLTFISFLFPNDEHHMVSLFKNF